VGGGAVGNWLQNTDLNEVEGNNGNQVKGKMVNLYGRNFVNSLSLAGPPREILSGVTKTDTGPP